MFTRLCFISNTDVIKQQLQTIFCQYSISNNMNNKREREREREREGELFGWWAVGPYGGRVRALSVFEFMAKRA